jgi:hypothetical protein
MSTRALAVGPIFGTNMVTIGEGHKAVDAGPGQDDHVSAISAITAIGPPTGHIFLAPETHAAVSTTTSNNFNLNAVNKHRNAKLLDYFEKLDSP